MTGFLFKLLLIGFTYEFIICRAQIRLSFKNFSKVSKEYVELKTDLLPNSEVTIYLDDVPLEIDFLIVQVHSFLYNTIVSSESSLTPENHIKGTNIGVFYRTNIGISKNLYLKNTHEFNVSCLLVAVPYSDESPVPGGCNMEAPTPIAPYLNLQLSPAIVTVEGSPASSSLLGNSCDMSSPLAYIMFYKYIPERDFSEETYFDAIRSMLTYPSIMNSSSYVAPEPIEGPVLRRVFNKYSGTGTVYSLVVFNKYGNIAVYTPTFTYACDNIFDSEPCELIGSPFLKLEYALLMSISAFVCFAGHRYFLGELFFMGTVVGGLVSYVILLDQTIIDGDLLLMSTGIGFISGIIWMAVWWCVNSPIISVALSFLANGFLISSTTFYFISCKFSIFQSDTNYWLLFFVLTFMVFILSTTNPVGYNIIACCFIGGYGILFPLDYYIGSNLKYILINVIRRATVEGFNFAATQPPFQLADGVLLILWVLFFVGGYKSQKKWSEHRPPFPPNCSILREHIPESMSEHLPESMPILTNARFPSYT